MKRLLALTSILLLSACGGGGGESSPVAIAPAPIAPKPATAEGLWSGKNSDGLDLAVGVLENGETWGTVAEDGVIIGAIYANTTSSGTTLSGSGSNFVFGTGVVAPVTYTGTFIEKTTIRTANSSGGTFSGTYISAYDEPASLAAAAGTYVGNGIATGSNPQAIAVSLSPTGAFTTSSSLGCSALGQANPRTSGKNIFNITVTFSGTNCALGNGAVVTGIAYFDSISKRLLVAALNPAKTGGFIYTGQK